MFQKKIRNSLLKLQNLFRLSFPIKLYSLFCFLLLVGCGGSGGGGGGSATTPQPAQAMTSLQGSISGSSDNTAGLFQFHLLSSAVASQAITRAETQKFIDVGFKDLSTLAATLLINPVVLEVSQDGAILATSTTDGGAFSLAFNVAALSSSLPVLFQVRNRSTNAVIARFSLMNFPFAADRSFRLAAVLRDDGSIVASIFPDQDGNGQPDLGSRILLDTGTDVNGDGIVNKDSDGIPNEFAARFDSPDGLRVFDRDGDGRFGEPLEDVVILRLPDSSMFQGTNLIDRDLNLNDRSDNQRELQNNQIGDTVNTIELNTGSAQLNDQGQNVRTVQIKASASQQGVPFDVPVTLETSAGGFENESTPVLTRSLGFPIDWEGTATLDIPLLVSEDSKSSFKVDAQVVRTIGGNLNVSAIISDSQASTGVVPNTRPLANASVDQMVTMGNSVQLDGSGSSDVDQDSLTHRWSLTTLPQGSNATLSSSNSVNPTFVADVAGSYVASLIVNDGTVDSNPDTVLIQAVVPNTPPIASAGFNQNVAVNATVQLDGSSSSDPNQDNLIYQWTLTTIPQGSNVTLSSPTSVNPTFVADVTGNYVVTLIVNDGTVNSDPDRVTITTANTPPLANAGADQNVVKSVTVTLDGSGPNQNPITHQWTLTTRPQGSSATLSNPTSVTPTFVADVAGNYVASLIVNDGTVNSNPDTVSIVAVNTAPIANAGVDQNVTKSATVTLDGSGSSDPNQDAITHQWTLTTRPQGSNATLSNPTSVNPTFVADVAGTYVASLVVSDGTVNSNTDTVSIVAVNTPPIANAGADQNVAKSATVTLDGSGSSDPNQDPITQQWTLTTRPQGSNATLSNPTSVTPTFVADVAGNYIATLIVNDGTVNSNPDTVSIVAVNTPPIANAGADQNVVKNATVTLDGSGSSDPNQDALTRQWTLTTVPQGSNATLSNPTLINPTFVADLAGTFVATLIVNDGTVNSNPDTASIVAVNTPPIANAGTDQSVGVNVTVQLDGSGSSDPNQDSITHQWTLTTRPQGSNATLSNATSVNPTFVTDVAGNYVATLVVNDGTVNSSPDTIAILANTPPVANAGLAQANLKPGFVITLDGSSSSDLDGDNLTFNWSFVSKPTGSTATLSNSSSTAPTFTADLEGGYQVQLIVNDGRVNSQPVTLTNTATSALPQQAMGTNGESISFLSLTDNGIVTGTGLQGGQTFSFNLGFTATNLQQPAKARLRLELVRNTGGNNFGADPFIQSTTVDVIPSLGGAQQSMWVFSDLTQPNEVTDAAKRLELVTRSADSGIDILYVSVFNSTVDTNTRPNGTNSSGRLMYEDSDMADLITQAHAKGLQVWAIYGTPDFPQLGCAVDAFPLQRMQEVVDYNTANPTAKFDGVMLDVEFTSTLGIDLATFLNNILPLYTCIRDLLQPNGIKLGVAIQSFWDTMLEFPAGGLTKPAYGHIVDLNLDQVVILGYREFAQDTMGTQGIISLDQDEINFADSAGKNNLILVGVETSDCVATNGCTEIDTFFEEGLELLFTQAGVVETQLNGNLSFGGFSIHRFSDTFLVNVPGVLGPPVNNLVRFNLSIELIDSTGSTVATGKALFNLRPQ